MGENNRLHDNQAARAPRFLTAAQAVQVAPARFGLQQAEPAPEKPLLSVVDGLRQQPKVVQQRSAQPQAAALASSQPVPPPEPVQAPAPEPVRILDPTPTPELLARISDGVDSLRLQGERLAAMARSDALELGFLVAQKILEMELKASPAPLFSLIRSALRRAGEDRVVSVRLHPADHEIVRGQLNEPLGPGLTVAEVKLEADPSLQRGDCVVETDFGTVDGRLGSRIGELRKALAAEGEGWVS